MNLFAPFLLIGPVIHFLDLVGVLKLFYNICISRFMPFLLILMHFPEPHVFRLMKLFTERLQIPEPTFRYLKLLVHNLRVQVNS